MEEQSATEFRSPICCVMGHVDAGKSSLLDKLRRTKFQQKEAGGITQNISAWNLSLENLRTLLETYPTKSAKISNIPGLLMIDTPGHEAFLSLRTTGANICDFAILVVDVHKGIENQTIESIRLLRDSKTPFIIAVNKIDTLSGWKTIEGGCVRENLKNQSETTQYQLEKARAKLIGQFACEGLNVEWYYQNKDQKYTVNMVPISARSGEGLPDLLVVLLRICEKFMAKRIAYNKDDLRGLVLDKEYFQGFGTGLHTILVDGELSVGDELAIHSMKSMRCKVKEILTYNYDNREYEKVREGSLSAAKVCIVIPKECENVDDILSGSEITSSVDISGNKNIKLQEISDVKLVSGEEGDLEWGIWLQAPSIGTLDALLKFFSENGVPIIGYGVGAIYKTDVMKIAKNIYPIIGNFSARITEEAEKEALRSGVNIITSPIIYHLYDEIQSHYQNYQETKKKIEKDEREAAIYPCKLTIEPNCVFRASNPIVVGVKASIGTLKKDTTLFILKNGKDPVELGKVHQIKAPNGDTMEELERGQIGTIEIRGKNKRVEESDVIYTKITRKSINMLKKHFKDKLQKEDVKLLVELKKILDIQ